MHFESIQIIFIVPHLCLYFTTKVKSFGRAGDFSIFLSHLAFLFLSREGPFKNNVYATDYFLLTPILNFCVFYAFLKIFVSNRLFFVDDGGMYILLLVITNVT
jgi:hypothetical protein